MIEYDPVNDPLLTNSEADDPFASQLIYDAKQLEHPFCDTRHTKIMQQLSQKRAVHPTTVEKSSVSSWMVTAVAAILLAFLLPILNTNSQKRWQAVDQTAFMTQDKTMPFKKLGTLEEGIDFIFELSSEEFEKQIVQLFEVHLSSPETIKNKNVAKPRLIRSGRLVDHSQDKHPALSNFLLSMLEISPKRFYPDIDSLILEQPSKRTIH